MPELEYPNLCTLWPNVTFASAFTNVSSKNRLIDNNLDVMTRLYQPAFTYAKLAIGTLEKGVKYIQS